MAYTRQSKDGKRVASTVYLRERKDKSAQRLAKKKLWSKSFLLAKILEDNLP